MNADENINAPLPHQLTVGKLRSILANASDEVVVGLRIPRGFQGDPVLTLLCNVRLQYEGGSTATFEIWSDDSTRPPDSTSCDCEDEVS
jgi:hypothetical protein